MSSAVELVLFDVGGVLGSNGWDREQREAAVERFHLDPEDFQYRHEETVGALEAGQISSTSTWTSPSFANLVRSARTSFAASCSSRA